MSRLLLVSNGYVLRTGIFLLGSNDLAVHGEALKDQQCKIKVAKSHFEQEYASQNNQMERHDGNRCRFRRRLNPYQPQP